MFFKSERLKLSLKSRALSRRRLLKRAGSKMI
jgi:hypothetical protein